MSKKPLRRIRVKGAFVGEDMKFLNRELCVENYDDKILISKAATCKEPYVDCNCVIVALPINMHAHILDNIMPEFSLEKSVDKAVGKPDSAKTRLIKKMDDKAVSTSIRTACRSMSHYRYAGIIEFREKNSRHSSTFIRCKKPYLHFVLSRPSNSDINEAYHLIKVYDGIGLPTPLIYDHKFLEDIGRRAREYRNKLVVTHVAETLEARVRGDLELAINYLRPHIIIHGNYLSVDDIDLIASNNVRVVVCPRNTLWFKLRVPNIAYMLDKDVLGGIGSDNAGLHGLDLWSHIQDLTYLSRLHVDSQRINYQKLASSVFVKPYRILGIGHLGEDYFEGIGIAFINNETTRITYSMNPWLSLMKRTSPIDVLGALFPSELRYRNYFV